MKRIYLILISILLTTFAFAAKPVSGIVTEVDGTTPIPGITVVLKGFSSVAMTDSEGRFSIEVPEEGCELVFTCIGYKTITKQINKTDSSVIKLIMEEDSMFLDGVVVVGYGTVKKTDVTSSISTVEGEELNKTLAGNAMSSLQGKISGVQVLSSGEPGSTPRVIIRGVSTVNGSDPLYVVDGVPVGNDISFLPQDDIERIDVLKDASASAIYGSRGSNGVILITTKKGKEGKTVFNFSTSIGFQNIDKPQMAKASEYEYVFKEAYVNDGNLPIWNSKDGIKDEEGTDWWDLVVRSNAPVQSYNFNFSGGSKKFIYSASISYFDQKSNYHYGSWSRLATRFNMEYIFNKIVKVGIDLNPNMEKSNRTPDLFMSAMTMDPTTPVMRPESEWTENQYDNYARSHNNQVWNPVATTSRMDNRSSTYGLLTNPWLSIEPITGLVLKTQFGLNTRFASNDSFTPKFFIDNLEKADMSQVYRSSNKYIDWDWTTTLTYMNSFGSHNINCMLGYTMEEFKSSSLWGQTENTPSNLPELRYPDAGTMNEQTGGVDASSSLISYLARAMYNYDSRYYLTMSLRVDGSSKFPKDNKYAFFPAVSAAWAVSRESFMKDQKVVSNLKLRAGWGRVGNQNIDSNAYLSLIGNADYVFGPDAQRNIGTIVSSIGNSSLKWETVEDWNVGLDLGFLNDRLTLSAEWFSKTSHDMLLKKDNLLILGYPMWNGQMWSNIGSMNATGWEFTIGWADVKKDFKYDINMNLSTIRNTAQTLIGGTPLLTGSFSGDYIIRNEEGGEISRFYGYIADGLFDSWSEVYSHSSEHGDLLQPSAQPGDIRFKDLNKDGVLDDKDKTWLGSAFPKLTLGLNFNFTYKGIDFSANFYGAFGNSIFNTTKTLYACQNGQNVWADTYDLVWYEQGCGASLPRLSVNDANNNYKKISSFFVEDGSYFRCKQLQIGYSFPKIKDVFAIRISFSAQNLFTITNYSGMDPERASMGSVTESGIDNIGYPNPRTFLMGINFSF